MSLFVIIQRQFQGSKLTKYKKDESGKNHHHWSTIGDPHGCLVGDPHIFIWNNQIFFWRPQIFIGDPIFSLDPQYFCWRPPDSRWCLHQKNGVSNENLGVFNENMAVSKENIGVSNENMGVSNKNLGVSNKNMEVFNETSMGSPIVLQWWWFLQMHSLFQLFHENFKLSPEACVASTIPRCGGEPAFLKEDFKNERTCILTSQDEDEELVQTPEQAGQ